jgi:PAS domain S-box-containing protein
MSESALTPDPSTLLSDAWENADVGLVVFDGEGKFAAVNETYCAMIGYTQSEVLELGSGTELAGDSATRDVFSAVLAGHRRVGLATVKRKDGSTLDVEFFVVKTAVAGLSNFVGMVWPQPGG